MHIVCEKLDELIKTRNLKLSEVQGVLGVTDTTLRKYRAGRLPQADSVLKICEAYNVTPNWMYGYEEHASMANEPVEGYGMSVEKMAAKLDFTAEALEEANSKIIEQRIELKRLKPTN